MDADFFAGPKPLVQESSGDGPEQTSNKGAENVAHGYTSAHALQRSGSTQWQGQPTRYVQLRRSFCVQPHLRQ